MPYSSRSKSFLLAVLGPLGVLIGLTWVLPSILDLLDGFDHQVTGERAVMSSLMDQSRRRDHLPVLTQIRIFGTPEDFRELLLDVVVHDDRVLVVGETKIDKIDLQDGSIDPDGADIGRIMGRVQSVSVSESDMWLHGSGGFAQFDPTSLQQPLQILTMDGEASRPVWFGNRIVASGYTRLLRFYEVRGAAVDTGRQTAASVAVLTEETGNPLFPGLDFGLSVYFNLVSLTVHPDQQWLAVAFQLSNRLHVYDLGGALKRAIAGPVEVKLDFDIKPLQGGGHRFATNSETTFSYLAVESNRDVIVALFAGRHAGAPGSAYTGDELHVFRWDGTPVGTWRIPEPVVAFHLDDANQRIYAVRPAPFQAVVELDASPLYQAYR